MRSWIEQAFGPAIAFAHEQAPLVQAMLAILPKFYSLGNDAEAGPMRWAGNLLPLEPRLHLFEACLERMAVVERAGLIRRPGDRKSGVEGKSVSVSVAHGGGR